jgi:HSP20 family protein
MGTEQTKNEQDGNRRPAASQGALARTKGASRELVPALPFASPFSLMRRFIEDLDLLMEGRDLEGAASLGVPPLEIVERDGKIVIEADVPGLTKDQIQVQVQDGQLVISGERRQEAEERQRGLTRSERIYGAFSRVVPLPEGARVDEAKASFANGVLEITVPVPAMSKARAIDIQEEPQAKTAH